MLNEDLLTVYRLVWPGSVTSGAEGFFLQNLCLRKRETGDPPHPKKKNK